MAQLLSNLPLHATVVDNGTKFYGVPIVWRVIGQNHAGDPDNSTTLLSDKIITIRAFDAQEPNNPDSIRKINGNNRYSVSNIRQWLNSDAEAGQWYSAQHEYDAPPTAENVYDGYNSYYDEAGFLTNFSENMKKALLPSVHRVALNTTIDGGGYEDITDKIFLLSRKEVGGDNNNNIAEGTRYFYALNGTAYPTAEAVEFSNYKHSDLSSDKLWNYLLRSPNCGYPSYSFFVTDSSAVTFGYSNRPIGVRPALCLPNLIQVSDEPDTDGNYIIEWSEPSVEIIMSETNLGNKWFPFDYKYQLVLTDSTSSIEVTEYIDDIQTRIISNASPNTDIIFDLSTFDSLSNETEHTLKIKAVIDNAEDIQTVKFTKLYNSIIFIVNPIATDISVKSIIFDMDYTPNEATMKIEATNCPYNENVIWEDITKNVQNNSKYKFENTIFDNEQYGLSIKITLSKSESIERIYITGYRYSYSC